jgi:hypothetical protein
MKLAIPRFKFVPGQVSYLRFNVDFGMADTPRTSLVGLTSFFRLSGYSPDYVGIESKNPSQNEV